MRPQEPTRAQKCEQQQTHAYLCKQIKVKREEVEQMVPYGVGEDTSMLITEWD